MGVRPGPSCPDSWGFLIGPVRGVPWPSAGFAVKDAVKTVVKMG